TVPGRYQGLRQVEHTPHYSLPVGTHATRYQDALVALREVNIRLQFTFYLRQPMANDIHERPAASRDAVVVKPDHSLLPLRNVSAGRFSHTGSIMIFALR